CARVYYDYDDYAMDYW
nr:immunoglobulin heavy chain junction region [Mus musculus]MBK4186024.1 immunoglobulin heavy chain junction region [Mus musculus]